MSTIKGIVTQAEAGVGNYATSSTPTFCLSPDHEQCMTRPGYAVLYITCIGKATAAKFACCCVVEKPDEVEM